MKPLTINVTEKTPKAGGSYSSYYKLDGDYGLKVLFSFKQYRSIKSLKKSNVWRRATSESTMLRKCKERFNKIPAAYGAVVVKCRNYYYAGILMEHISGPIMYNKLSANEDPDGTKAKTAISKLYRAMKRVGIYHYDLHECNIIFNNKTKQYWVIDFFPEFVDLIIGNE